MPNTVQLKKNGQPVFPVTDVSLVMGLAERPLMDAVYAWDGTGAPDITKIPAGVTVEYNSTTYTGTLAASASTTARFYLVPSTTVPGEFDRYLTDAVSGSYAWKPAGTTAIPTPSIVDNLESTDPTKALSAKQGKVLNEEVSQLEQEVDENINEKVPLVFISSKYINLGGGIGTTIPEPSDSVSFSYCKHKANEGDKIIINGTGGIGPRLWGFVDSSDKILAVSNTSITGVNLEVIAPENSAYIIINTNDTSTPSYYYKKDSLRTIVNTQATQIAELDDRVDGVNGRIDSLHPYTSIDSTMAVYRTDSGKFLKANGDEDSNASYSVLVYDITNIRKIRVKGSNASTTVRVYNFYNDDTIGSATLVSPGPEMSSSYDYVVDVPEGATYLACTKYDSQSLSVFERNEVFLNNEIKVEDGNKVTLSIPSADKRLYIVIGSTAPGVGNGLIDFRYWGYIKIQEDIDSTPTKLYDSTSDCFGPFQIRAKSNIDGDDVDGHTFTGGSHQYNNNITGSTPTARLGNVEIRVDGIRQTSFSGAFSSLEMVWEAYIQATNTKKSDGTGREVLKEIITLKYVEGRFECITELVPLEDLYFDLWYGYQICGLNPGGIYSIGDHWKYINATNRGLDNNKSGNKDTISMVAYSSDFHQEMWIEPSIDLGRRTFCYDNADNGCFKSGTKGYFMIANNSYTIYQDSHYFLYGKYIFKLK